MNNYIEVESSTGPQLIKRMGILRVSRGKQSRVSNMEINDTDAVEVYYENGKTIKIEGDVDAMYKAIKSKLK